MAADQRGLQSFAGRGGHVETAIGVFASRDRAEQAVGQLRGLAGAGAGSTVGSAVSHDAEAPKPTPDEKCSEDAAFFREVLKEGRSLIVVRTESQELATSACGILDRLGLGMHGPTPVRMQTAIRQVGDVTVLEDRKSTRLNSS